MFLLLDKPNMDNDMRLAAHVTHVHMHSAAPELQFTPIPELVLRYAVGVPWVPASLGVPSQEGAGEGGDLQWLYCRGASHRPAHPGPEPSVRTRGVQGARMLLVG
jgi:hypothetical protein